MRRFALAVLLVASGAAAELDADYGRSDPIAVRASLDGTTARMFVDYRLVTSAEESITQFELPLPVDAVVSGATITHAGATHRMTLGPLENVEKQFNAAFEERPPRRTPTMWLAKIDQSSFGLQGYGVSIMLATPIAAELLVTLEITAPTCFVRDARYVQLPEGWERTARATKGSDEVLAACTDPDDGSEMPNAWKSFAAADASRLPSGERLLVSTARLAIDSDLHLARTELVLAANIADVPRDLATVILVDESRSMNTEQRTSQREIVLGYLRAAPNSRVQVIAFARRTRTLLPAWMIASRARPRLERELATLTPRNGSNFDLGLADAGRLLSTVRGTRRVVLITDEAMASRLARQPETLAKLVPPDTIINVVVTGDGGDTLERHDAARLARLAAVTTGFSTMLGEVEEPVDASSLVRPMSLDNIEATGLGWTELDESSRESLRGENCSGSLGAGRSCVWWTRGTRFANTIQIEGMLWNRRVVRLVRPLTDPTRSIAREIAGTGTKLVEEDEDGTDTIGRRIDALARAVTATTSLFVRWGGDVPFSDESTFGGMARFGRSSTIGHITDVGGTATQREPPVDLSAQLRPLVASCGLGTTRAEIDIELTFLEIVDVDVTIEATGARTAAIRTCIEDVVWDFKPSLSALEPLRTEHIVL